MADNSPSQQGEYSVTSFDTGLYHVELAHKSRVPPIKSDYGFEGRFPSQNGEIFVIFSNDKVEVGIESSGKTSFEQGIYSPVPVVHLARNFLAQKTLKDIMKGHSYSLVIEDTRALGARLDNTLRIASRISERLKFSPSNTLRYINETLGVNPAEFINAEDIENYRHSVDRFNEDAMILALGEVLGFHKVRESANITGEPQIPERTINIQSDDEKMRMLASLVCKDPGRNPEMTGRMEKFLILMSILREKTYKAQNIEELIPLIQRRNGASGFQPEALEIENLAYPLSMVGCIIYDKFGPEVAQDFFARYFLKEHQKERELAGNITEKTQMAVKVDLSEKPKTDTQRKLKEALDFSVMYSRCQQDLGDMIKHNILEKNKSHPALFSQFQQTMLIDSSGILPELSRIEVVAEKRDGGKIKRRYLLEGKEISFDEPGMFYTGKRAVVDALDELRKKGDKRRISPLSVGTDYNGRKINFNDIFLFAVHGARLNRKFSYEETKVLYDLERMINEEYEFEYDEIKKTPYDIYRGKEKIGTVMIPEKISPLDLKRMNVLDAVLNADSDISTCMSDILKMLKGIEYSSDEEIMDGRVSIRNMEFKVSSKKTYNVKRRLKGAGKFETLGRISIEGDMNMLRRMDFRHLADGGYLDDKGTQEALALNRIKYSGIDYIENGEVYIVRQQSLDELLEEFHQMSGGAGAELDLKMVRITNTANRKYFELLLEKMMNKGHIGYDEVKELERARKNLGISVANDTQKIFMLETAYLMNKGIVEHISLPIAIMAGDYTLSIAEMFLLELYLGVMDVKKVPGDIRRFYQANVDELVKEKYTPKKEEEELLNLIKTTIIKGNGQIKDNPDYMRIRTILADLTLPAKQKAEEYEGIKARYSQEFMGDLLKTIDELPERGERVFIDLFYDTFNTSKRDLGGRVKQLLDDEKTIEDAGTGLFIIETTETGESVHEKELRRYLYAMSSLSPEIRERMAENMMTWATADAHVEIAYLIASTILSKENMERVKQEKMQGHDEIDDAWADVFEEAPKEEGLSATREIFEHADAEVKKLQKKYGIQKDLGVTEDDLKSVFGEEEKF